MNSITDDELQQFHQTIYGYYEQHGRHDLPWRLDTSPYAIFISELMLQQTRVVRVIQKFRDWMKLFPNFSILAAADQADVLRAWQGLGYNRRARYVHQSAQLVMDKFNGQLPEALEELTELPGVGLNTAGAIMAYAFNKPTVYIETNIRTVYIHHFFNNQDDVEDKHIIRLVEATLDRERPQHWYWALMDYGVHLKQTKGNMSRRAKNYKKQSKFEGSFRQLRAQVLRTVLANEKIHLAIMKEQFSDERLHKVLSQLQAEGLITESDERYSG